MERDRVLASSSLVGNVQGRRFNIQTLRSWVLQDVAPFVQSPPEVKMIHKGWIHLQFSNVEDVRWMARQYYYGRYFFK